MNKKNLANAQLLNSIGTSDTVIQVKQGQGANLPVPPFYGTFTPLGVLSTIDNSEIVYVTAINVDELTIVRGQRGTTAKEFSADSVLANGIYIEDVLPGYGSNGQVLKMTGGVPAWGTDTNTTYSEISTAEIEAKTASTARAISGRRVNDIVKEAMKAIYDVGSYYWNATDPTSPATKWGFGTWEQVTDKFILAAGTTFAAGTSGGHKELQAHSHNSGSLVTNTAGNHNHSVEPTQGITRGPNGSGSHDIENSGGRSISALSIGYSGNHSHSISGSTGSTGTGDSGNMPPYETAYCWKRIA